MPSATPSASSSLPQTSSLYPLAIIDVGSDSLRLCLEPTAPSSSSSSSTIHRAPNAIARPRPPSKQVYVGSAIEERCPDYSGLILRLPIERGLITDWVAQKAIWDVEIARALKELKMLPGRTAGGKLLEGWNLVITEAYMNLPELEAGLETMWFEEYGVRGVWRTTAAQLASFATGSVSQAGQTATSTKAQSSQLEATPKQPLPASSPPPPPPRSAASDASQPPPAKRPRRSAAPASSPTSPPPTASSPEGGEASKRPSTATRERQPRRPEACLIVDLGNSYIHAVPLISHEISWAGVCRLDLGGKVMTNLLKEQISFRQWDMTDETWLMARLKERAFFVAASEYGDDGERDESRPSGWTPKMLLRRGKALEQEFVLPDYTGNAKLARDQEKRYGRIVRGPCAVPGGDEGVDEATRDDGFIADVSALEAERQRPEKSADDDNDEDEDDEDDGDYRESGSEAGSESGVKAVAPPRPAPVAAQTKKQVSDDDEQILLLCHERWQIPEILFRPEQLGLSNTLPLPSLILSAIETAANDDEAVRGLMLCNVFLIGGLSSLPGLRRRIEADLRAIAPTECPVRVRTLGESAAMDGARQCPAKFLQAKMMGREQWEAEGSAGARHRFGSWSAAAAASASASATGTIHRVSRGGSTQAKSQR